MTDSEAKPTRILVIDDNPNVRDIFGRMLQLEGYDVSQAESGEAALGFIEAEGVPDLAIVDLNMPGMGGFAFCEEAQKRYRLPVIIMTVADDQRSIIQALNQYAEDYIIKPTTTAQLLARVRRVLRRIH